MTFGVLKSGTEAVAAVKRALSLGASCSLSESRFEVVRATVWSLAGPASRVHTNRILSEALPSWQLLSEGSLTSEEAHRSEIREALAVLEDVGDLLQSSGGYWTPATARIVKLPEKLGNLLIGGAPSSLLPIPSSEIEYHGPHRHLASFPPNLEKAASVEDFVSWAKLPDLPIQDWAREVVNELERQPYAPMTAESFEFYLPENSRPGAPQFKRWFNNPGSATGTLLARRVRLYGAREYRLVDVQGGRIVGICELHDMDVRRLMYALDLTGENPTRAKALRLGASVEWRFTSELPRPEQRIFASLGALTIPPDRPFERRWAFVRNEQLVLQRLHALGIDAGQQRQEG
jgi:hypothetical protein